MAAEGQAMDVDLPEVTMPTNVSAPQPQPMQQPMQPMLQTPNQPIHGQYRPGIDPHFLRPFSPPGTRASMPNMSPPSVMVSNPMRQPDFTAGVPPNFMQLNPDMLRMLGTLLSGMLPAMGAPMVQPPAPMVQPPPQGPSAPPPAQAPAAAPTAAAAAPGTGAAAAAPGPSAAAPTQPDPMLQDEPAVQASVDAASDGLDGFKYIEVDGKRFRLMPDEVQPRPATRTNIPPVKMPAVKMPAPPKFTGKVDKDIMDVDLWMRDVRKFAARSGLSLQDALETVTTGDARIQVDNMTRDPATAGLTEQQFADRFAQHFRTQVLPKAERARQDLHSGKVCMAPGSRLHEYVSKFRSVILDASPMLASDSIHWFQAGLTPELKAECHTDVRGERFTTLEALIQHAFVQEEKLAYKAQASTAQKRTDAHLNAMQGDGRPAKKGRWNNHNGGRNNDNRNNDNRSNEAGGQDGKGGRGGGRGGRGGARGGRGGRGGAGGGRPRTSGRDDWAQAVYQLGRKFNKCTLCLNVLPPAGHHYEQCPMKSANNAPSE
jgi:hypothetical protein